MKSIRFRLLIAAVAVLLGSALAKSQTAADAPAPPPMHAPRHARPHHASGIFSPSPQPHR